MHDALHALVIGAVGAGPQLAGDPTIAVPWEVALHLRDGRTEIGIGIALVPGAFARPSVVDTSRQPDPATSSPGAKAAGPEMINDRPLLVAEAAISLLFSKSSS